MYAKMCMDCPKSPGTEGALAATIQIEQPPDLVPSFSFVVALFKKFGHQVEYEVVNELNSSLIS